MVRFSPSIKTFCLYVIREKQDQIWAKIFCFPKNMDSRTLMLGQVAKLARGLFHCWSSLCNNNMATNLLMFTSSYNIKRFAECDC